jgi:hypothetical protein
MSYEYIFKYIIIGVPINVGFALRAGGAEPYLVEQVTWESASRACCTNSPRRNVRASRPNHLSVLRSSSYRLVPWQSFRTPRTQSASSLAHASSKSAARVSNYSYGTPQGRSAFGEGRSSYIPQPCHICTRLGSPLPHLHRDWARPYHVCTGTGLAPATSTGTGLAAD